MEMLPPLRGHDNSISSVDFSPVGSKIVSGSDDKTIRVWDASTGVEMLLPLRGHHNWICSVAFSPDGSKIISSSDDGTIRVWDASIGVELPCTHSAVGDNSKNALDGPIVSLKEGWFSDINTGRQVHGFTCVGWTMEHKLVIIHLPYSRNYLLVGVHVGPDVIDEWWLDNMLTSILYWIK
jgi:WD40 repeat protein